MTKARVYRARTAAGRPASIEKVPVRDLIGHLPLMLSITDARGRFLWVNRQWQRTLGWSLEEARRRDIFAKTVPDPRDREEVLRWARTGRGRRVFHARRKDGTFLDTLWDAVPLPDGNILGIGQDITERTRAEAALVASREQLRRLAARASAGVERERTELARELHDQLGQVLTGLKMDAVYLRDRVRVQSGGRPLAAKADQIIAAIDGLFQTIRRISTELRPGVLDRLGLLEAIRLEAREFERRSGIRCRVESSLERIDVDAATAIHVFRVVQEALTNAGRHAEASRVAIRLGGRGGVLRIEVRDNGRGISDAALADPNALGLVGMQERALLFGGDVEVARAAGNGTIVTIIAPVERRAAPRSRAGRGRS